MRSQSSSPQPQGQRTSPPRPKGKRATIHDVAREVGVSIYAVSRALNNAPGVNPKDREQILDTSRRLGVRPRPVARQSHFAMIIPDVGYVPGGYVPNVAFSLLRELSAHGLGLSLFSDSQLNDLMRRVFDGIFLLSWSQETIDRIATLSGTPVVVVNRFSQVDRFHVVGWDHVAEGRTVAQYLVDRNHMRPGFVSLNPHHHSTRSRLQGFAEAFASAGHELAPERIEILQTPEYLVNALERLVRRGVDALYLPGQERLGLKSLPVLQKVFRKVIPDEVSVIGGENPGWSELSDPPLTTVAAPFDLLAKRSVSHMIKLLERKRTRPTEVLISTPIIERNTVANR